MIAKGRKGSLVAIAKGSVCARESLTLKKIPESKSLLEKGVDLEVVLMNGALHKRIMCSSIPKAKFVFGRSYTEALLFIAAATAAVAIRPESWELWAVKQGY